MATQSDAYAQLPKDAVWSSSFGYPGEGGFNEFWRQPDGTRWLIENGPWDGLGRNWTCRKFTWLTHAEAVALHGEGANIVYSNRDGWHLAA